MRNVPKTVSNWQKHPELARSAAVLTRVRLLSASLTNMIKISKEWFTLKAGKPGTISDYLKASRSGFTISFFRTFLSTLVYSKIGVTPPPPRSVTQWLTITYPEYLDPVSGVSRVFLPSKLIINDPNQTTGQDSRPCRKVLIGTWHVACWFEHQRRRHGSAQFYTDHCDHHESYGFISAVTSVP